MKRLLAALAFAIAPLPALAGVDGLRLEGGPVWLTKSGSIGFGASALESDAGVAFRGRLRVGLGAFSVAGDLQSSFQDYGNPGPGAPQDLNATFVGVVAGVHPITLVKVTPYGELGRGRLTFSDEAIEEDGGFNATMWGLGALVSFSDKLGLDVSLRLLKQGGLRVSGVAQEFEYDPKLFTVMLSLKL
jgi:hypothetical protein